MIKIYMYENKWRILVGESEEFEFKTFKEFNNVLKLLIKLKEQHGRVKN